MRTSWSGRTTGRFTIVLLALAVIMTAVLAYEAWLAERRHRATVEAVLRDHAEIAAWHFVSSSYYNLYTVTRAFAAVAGLRITTGTPLPPLTDIPMTGAGVARCADPALERERYYFRVDLRNGSIKTAGAPVAPPLTVAILDTVTPRVRRRTIQDWYLAPVFRNGIGGPRSLVFIAVRDEHDRPVGVYGFETCNGAVWQWVFREVMRYSLLPPALTRGLPNDSLLSVDATVLGAAPVRYVSAVSYPVAYSAQIVDTVKDASGDDPIRVRISLRPSMAGQLVIGGLPRSRLPLLVSLMLLVSGVIVVALLQLRRERELLRLRADFTSSVSHELRTPLAEILLFAETLEMGRVRDDTARDEAIRVIAQEARRLANLVNNVLQFSRAERHALHFKLHRAALSPALREIVSSFTPLASTCGSSVRLELDDSITVPMNLGALHQIVLNLLDNALKYGPIAGTIVVRSGLNRGLAIITVEDEGSGIPPADRTRIWQPFVRLQSTSPEVTGSGIGLAVVRELVKAHGGRCRVEEAESGGAAFIVELAGANGVSVAQPPVESGVES